MKGTAASRVFCRLEAEAVEWESNWSDTIYLGLTRPQRSLPAASLIRSIRFAQVEPSNLLVRSRHADKTDAVKTAKYGLDNWVDLQEYTPIKAQPSSKTMHDHT